MSLFLVFFLMLHRNSYWQKESFPYCTFSILYIFLSLDILVWRAVGRGRDKREREREREKKREREREGACGGIET